MTFVAEWDEIVTLTVPFTTTVELGDDGAPGETEFTLDVVHIASPEELGKDMYKDVTVSASLTTNGKGDYDGTMTFTGPYQQLKSMFWGGVYVQQADDGQENWTYDDRIWCLVLWEDIEIAMLDSTDDTADDTAPGYKVLIYQAACEETEYGPVYSYDWENTDPAARMLFTNTYTAHDYTMKRNETEHWDECGCGDVQNREAHRYGEWTVTKEATETESGEQEHTCTVCGYTETVEIEKLPHIHDYTLEHNETEHWDECGCGDVQNREAHRYGEWTVTKEATETESGEKEHTCTVCGYTETAEIEKLPVAETNPDTGTGTDNTNTNVQSPQTGNNSNIVLWFSLMLVAGAALAGTAVYAHKKKRSR